MAKVQKRKSVSLSAEGFKILQRLSRQRQTPKSAILEELIRKAAGMRRERPDHDARSTRGLGGVTFYH